MRIWDAAYQALGGCRALRGWSSNERLAITADQLNGKVERSHRSDQEEFYQLLTYTDDVDLNSKLARWEEFYNHNRPHGAHGGKTPYEALRATIQ